MTRLLDDELIDHIASLPDREAGKWLVLEPHAAFDGYWQVNGVGRHFRFDLHEVIGSQRVVSPANLTEFLDHCKDLGYEVAWGEPPEAILDSYKALSQKPEIEIESDLPGTVNGLLPFQVRGFNKLKDLEGGAAVWSTGTGKSVLTSALIKYHAMKDNFELCFVVCKGHNKINAQRSLLALAGIDSVLLDGTIGRRVTQYIEVMDRLAAGEKVAIVTNYEKFRDDFCEFYLPKGKKSESCRIREEFAPWFTDRNLLFLWDEMPTKVKNRTSKLYAAICTCLYDTYAPKVSWEKRRAKILHQYMLSATPIENHPGDWFSCERLLNGGRTFGTVTDFENRYVAYYDHFNRNKPKGWHRLDDMQLRGAHIMSVADKERDPEIKKQFPEFMPVKRVLDWTDYHRGIYDKAQELAEKAIDDAEEDGEPFNPLGLLAVLKMICAMPSSLANSAALRLEYENTYEEWLEGDGSDASEPRRKGSEAALQLLNALGAPPKDEGHTKLTALQEIIFERHPEEKIVWFSSLNHSLIPIMMGHLDDWGVSYVRYEGTLKQKQAAQDAFKYDPSIRLFVSSDKGSDSLNLEEARIVVNHDLPFKYSTKTQRVNRCHRVTSTLGTVWAYDLLMGDSVDERWDKLIEKKRQYHEGVFQGAAMHGAISAGMDKSDLLYALRGY